MQKALAVARRREGTIACHNKAGLETQLNRIVGIDHVDGFAPWEQVLDVRLTSPDTVRAQFDLTTKRVPVSEELSVETPKPSLDRPITDQAPKAQTHNRGPIPRP